MKIIIPVVVAGAVLLYSCNQKQSSTTEASTLTTKSDTPITQPAVQQPDTQATSLAGSTAAKKWLIIAIEGAFNDTKNYPEEKITTKAYEAYKTDATGVGYDGGLTEEEFNKKYSTTHDVKHAGTGVGFLISGQDNGKIKVTQCDLLKQDASGYLFKTTINDVDGKVNYHRDIKVIPAAGGYLIDDVLEYD